MVKYSRIQSTLLPMRRICAVMVPPLWQAELVDGFLSVSDDEAVATARSLATREGIFAGFSAGANVFAALQVAATCAPGMIVATIACDTAARHVIAQSMRPRVVHRGHR